ncbi:hypothetical protein [Alsobacter sp. SYSU BS001988]
MSDSVAFHENDPRPGYYRMRARRGGPWTPVAIWAEGDAIRALKGSVPVHPCDVWTWCCRHPISYETYVAVAERGEPWPDEPPPTGLSGIGHNRIGAAPHEVIMAQTAELREAGERWLALIGGGVATQVQADKAANFAARFAALEKAAEDARTAAKRPSLEAGRSVDATWKPVVAEAQAAKTWMKKALEPFLLAAWAAAEAAGLPTTGDAAPRAGSAGRRIGLKRVVSVEVVDRAALQQAYRDDARLWRDADVATLVTRLALADLEAGLAVAGARLIEQRVAV